MMPGSLMYIEKFDLNHWFFSPESVGSIMKRHIPSSDIRFAGHTDAGRSKSTTTPNKRVRNI
jgi:hypothetical protein